MFSPEGRWILYAAKETDRDEQICVSHFLDAAGAR
jgi:hypothetical protein